MALDISPLYDVVQSAVPCLVHDGNYSFTPLDYSQLCVVFTLTAANRLSTPRVYRRLANNPAMVNETWVRSVEYVYQLDVFRQVTVDMEQHYPEPQLAPPFETEAFTVIDSINFARPRLSKERGLHVLPLTEIAFELTQVTGSIACNRAYVTFSILADSIIKFTSTQPAVRCVQPQFHRIHRTDE